MTWQRTGRVRFDSRQRHEFVVCIDSRLAMGRSRSTVKGVQAREAWACVTAQHASNAGVERIHCHSRRASTADAYPEPSESRHAHPVSSILIQ
jgi:hypothetical protein